MPSGDAALDTPRPSRPQAKPAPSRRYALLLLPAALGVFLLLAMTRWGAGVSPDSVEYIRVARGILASLHGGEPGAWRTLTSYPPLYPLLLAAAGVFGTDPLLGARWLAAALFGGSIFLAGAALLASGRRLPTALAAGFLLATSEHMLSIHSFAWSEAPFVFFGFLGLGLLARSLEASDARLRLAAAGAIALAFLARYAGASLVMTGILLLALRRGLAARLRIRDAILFGAVACAPMALWVLRNVLTLGVFTGHSVRFHLIPAPDLARLFDTLSSWLAPERVAIGVRLWVLLAVVLGAGIISLRLGSRPRERDGLAGVLWSFSGVYLVFILAYVSFSNLSTALDTRIFILPLVAVLVAAATWVERAYLAARPRSWPRLALAVFCALLALSYSAQAASMAAAKFQMGAGGYATRSWSESELIDRVRRLPDGVPIYSNAYDAIYILTGKETQSVPVKADALHQTPNPTLLRDIVAMVDDLAASGGYVVFCDRVNWRWYLLQEAEVVDRLPLKLIERVSDGAIYLWTP